MVKSEEHAAPFRHAGENKEHLRLSASRYRLSGVAAPFRHAGGNKLQICFTC